MVGCKYRAIRTVAFLCLSALWVQAAPFEKTIRFTQPDGQQIELWGKGDEFHAVFEHDGYTVVFDAGRKTYTYAKLSADGKQLLPTRLDVGTADPRASGLPQHLRISAEADRAAMQARFERWDAGMQVSRRWAQRKTQLQTLRAAKAAGSVELSPPSFTTTGTKVGLCLLIDFSDDPATIPQADIVDFCNADDFTGYGNNGSVKQYFLDNSKNQLTYTNVVTAYIRMALPKSHYNDTGADAGVQANELIKDALDILKASPNYETEILPTFSSLTVDDDNQIMACNVFYAGGNGGVWANGLWPHSWALYMVGPQDLEPGGMSVFRYQITNIGNTLQIGTFCHENGHMLCGYPDLYDYDYDSVGGAGNFCLMGYGGGDDRNPVQVCAYLKYASGWATTVEVTKRDAIFASVSSELGEEEFNKFYRFEKPGSPTEYYLFENRQQSGRDANIPGAGVAIWHVDEQGDRDNQSLVYNSTHANYECTLMQADNLWHFQSSENAGDENDLFFEGNTAAGYMNRLADSTAPSARWWDGTKSYMDVDLFSEQGPVMTFVFETPPPVIATPPVLPDGRVGTFYAYSFMASNGATPYAWSVIAGDLPDGLSLSGTGRLSGMPTTAGVSAFTVAVMGANNKAATNQFSLTILDAFTAPFTETFEADGALPSGWAQEYVSNAIPWTFANGNGSTVRSPATAHSGSYNARLKIDQVAQSGSATRLVSPLVIFDEAPGDVQLSFWHYMAKSSLFQDQLNVYYKTAYGDEWTLLETYTQSVNVWTKRTIHLPSTATTYYVAFEGTAKFGYGVHIDDVEIADVYVPFGFASESPLPEAVINQPYSTTLAGVSGVPPYTFALTNGVLPVGLSLETNGVISGTSSVLGSSTFTVAIIDAASNTVEKTFTLDVVLPRAELFVERFENGGALPAGWTQVFVTNKVAWKCQAGGGNGDSFHMPESAYEGTYNAVLWADSYSNNTTRLNSPAINLGAAPSDVRLDFWHCMGELVGAQDMLRVYYKNSASGVWQLLAAYTNNVSKWTRRSLPLPEPSSTYYLAFEGTARFGQGVCIDNVRITDGSLAPIINTVSPLPRGEIGVAYSVALSAVGGMRDYTWELVSGTLPTGMTFSADGVLSGVPGEARASTINVRVIGADGYASTNQMQLTISGLRTLPYVQDFEAARQLPIGWSQEYVYGTMFLNWMFYKGSNIGSPGIPAAAHSGTNNALLATVNSAGFKSRLITPVLNMGVNATNTRLSFWMCMAKKSYQDELKVLYKTNASDTAWTQLAYFKSSITAWTNVVLDLPNPSPSYQIAFEGYAKAGYGVCIDDVEVTGDVVYQSAYEQWKQDMFGADAGDPLIAGDLADPDMDGIENWREYALALDPLSPDAEGLPTGGVTAGYLTLSYRENQSASDVLFQVEACTDLLVQDWTTNGVSEILRGDSNLWWQVTTRHDVPVTNAPQRFLRLKLTWPAP